MVFEERGIAHDTAAHCCVETSMIRGFSFD
jgi:hypothetical protein